jgi:hypothetical protein
MKALALAALLATSLTTGASAACNILSATDGTWEFDANTGYWEATTPAVFVVKVKNATEIVIKAMNATGAHGEKTMDGNTEVDSGSISYWDPGTRIEGWDVWDGRNTAPNRQADIDISYTNASGPRPTGNGFYGNDQEYNNVPGNRGSKYKFSKTQIDLLQLQTLTGSDSWIFRITVDGYFRQSNPNNIDVNPPTPFYHTFHRVNCKDGSETKDDAKWGGFGNSTPDPSCTFVRLEDGDMSLQNDLQTWRVTSPAVVEIDFDNINRITVEPENGGEILGGPVAISADIDYTGSTITPNTTGTQSVVDDDISITGLTGLNNMNVVINLDGDAEPTSTVVYDANTDYRVPHVITCVY